MIISDWQSRFSSILRIRIIRVTTNWYLEVHGGGSSAIKEATESLAISLCFAAIQATSKSSIEKNEHASFHHPYLGFNLVRICQNMHSLGTLNWNVIYLTLQCRVPRVCIRLVHNFFTFLKCSDKGSYLWQLLSVSPDLYAVWKSSSSRLFCYPTLS